MKKYIFLIFLSLIVTKIYSQTPGIISTKYIYNYVGDENVIYDSKEGIDGGFIIVGADSGWQIKKNEAITKNFGGRPWIVKLDDNGEKVWSRVSLKGIYAHNSSFTSVCTSASGLYVAAGYGGTTSNLLVSAYNASGLLMWDTSYGGSGIDRATSIQSTADGGYILAGFTTSNDGTVTGNHSPGTADIWLVKIDANRNIQWKKCYGGSGADTAYAILPTPDNGFIVAGASASFNGDLTGNNGLSDGWVFKTDNTGNIIWQKNIGGPGHEGFRGIVLNSDDTYTLTGHSGSASLLSNGIKGRSDVWVIKVAGNNGNTIWSKGYGGTLDEHGLSIQRTQGNGYLVAGFTESSNGDITFNSGGTTDGWLLNLDNDGLLVWQKTIGTTKSDYATKAHYISANNYVVTGFGESPVVTYDSTDGFFVRLGNSAYLRGNLVFPRLINSGIVKAVKPGKEYSTVPVNGIYQMDVDTGTYTVSYDPQVQYYSASASVVKNIPAYHDTGIVNFNVTALPAKRDLAISAVALISARPGFDVFYRLVYKNAGTDTVANGQIIFNKDSRLNLLYTVPAFTSVSGDTLKWNFTNLKPLDSGSITIRMVVQSPPAVNINDTLSSMAIITPVTGDITPTDDTAILKQRVQGPYDPNDKTENLAGRISVQQVSTVSYINYLVRFQNTGNDTAFNISIRDTLDQKLDWSSLQMVSSSHAYQLNIKSQNQLTWNFNNIMLVDSNHNENGSHGFIAYRIKPKNNLVIGDVIKNTASIYFDYNLPVRTNTQETVVVQNSIPQVAQPGITSFKPVAAGSGTTVTITGTNLTGATAVSFGGIAATSFTVNSATSITAVVSTGASGNVSVTTPGGIATLAGFTFIPQPAISSFTPTSAAAGASITITGANFTGATAVSFGGVAATSFTVNSSTSITAVVSTGASGNVSVTTPGGIATLAGFTFIPQPTISSFTPTSAAAGASVTIIGTNFTGAIAVSFGGVAATSFTVNSSTSITVVVGTGASGNVSVTTAGGTATRAGFIFIPQPTISSFTPASAATGTSITITGTNFTGATVVTFGGTAATSFTVNSSTNITAVVGAGASGNVSVTTAGGTSTLAGFTFIPPPTISSFTPASAATGASITITGTNFTGATAVNFGGIAATSFTINSSTSITAVVGAGASGNVSVTTPGGTSTLAGFTFIPQPAIASFTPTSGATGASVIITGTNFTGATAVSFGGTAATSFTVNSSTSITAVVGAGASGSVSVTTPGGMASLAGFTLIPQPTISSFTPASGAAGTSITITGTNFTEATAVSIGGVAAASFVINSTTSISAVVGTGASGDITVTTPYGTATAGRFAFEPSQDNNELIIYPNPADEFVQVKHPSTELPAQLRVIDLAGKVVKVIIPERNASETRIDLKGLQQGIYEVVWSDRKNKASQKLMLYK